MTGLDVRRPRMPERGGCKRIPCKGFYRSAVDGRRRRRRINDSALFLHHVVPDGVGRSVLEACQLRAGCLERLVVVPSCPVLP